MSLGPDDVLGCRYSVAELIRYRRLIGAPIPDWLRRLHDRLDAELRASVSDIGPGSDTGEQHSRLIGVTETAAILGCSTRHVRRLAADIDGQRAGRAWVFDRAIVTAYARARTE